MILFVDETESNSLFIVAGLLVESNEVVESEFRLFKKKAAKLKIPKKSKANLFTEFKSTLMDRDYSKLKKELLEHIMHCNPIILYCCLNKKKQAFSQIDKETTYLKMISTIVLYIEKPAEILFDSFGISRFEDRIVRKISSISAGIESKPVRSETKKGIIMVDNICSVLRLNEEGRDKRNHFHIISHATKKLTWH